MYTLYEFVLAVSTIFLSNFAISWNGLSSQRINIELPSTLAIEPSISQPFCKRSHETAEFSVKSSSMTLLAELCVLIRSVTSFREVSFRDPLSYFCPILFES